MENMNESHVIMKRHAVVIPFPAQGHVTPMLKLAKLLNATHNFHISFVNTLHNHRRLLHSHGPSGVSGLPSYRFHFISDGLPPAENPNATQEIPALCNSINQIGANAFRDLLFNLNSAGDAPPVSCVVADTGMAFAVDAAEELGLPVVRFWTASACGLLGYAQYDCLVEKGIIPLSDSSCLTNGYLDKVVDEIPSMEGITLKYLPSFIRTTDINDLMLNKFRQRLHTISTSRCPLILNTFDALEDSVLQTLAATKITNTPVFPIGPLSLHLTETNEPVHSKIRPNFLPNDPCCLPWLDTKPPNSIIYINYGSITTLTSDQVMEFARGLVNSMQSFLWVIRPDLVGSVEPGSIALKIQELVDGTQGKGMLASWCDQEKVLAHPSVGGFLTHCGWNSTVEALSHGVPMVCWPFSAEQMTNCWFCCEKWGVGAEIMEVTMKEVERVVRIVMEGDKGKEMKRKAGDWKKLAEDATMKPNGLSCLNFDKLVNHLIGA